MSDFATNLKRIREECGLTQVELANLAGIRQSHISAWELGNREPLAPSIIAIANALNVSADVLLGINNNCLYEFSKGAFNLARIFCDQDCYDCVRRFTIGRYFELLNERMKFGFSRDGYREEELEIGVLDRLTKIYNSKLPENGKEKYLNMLFINQSRDWGICWGTPILWATIARRFTGIRMSELEQYNFSQMYRDEFKFQTGYDLDNTEVDTVYVPLMAYGGMSSGEISIDFFRKGLSNLLKLLDDSNK